MAGVRFDQNQIKPGVSKCRASATIVKVMETIAEPMGLGVSEAAYGIHLVANATMVRAIKGVTTYRGRDPRDFSIFAFGGNGGVHGAGLARSLEIGRVIIPPAAGVFSAVGLLVAKQSVTLAAAFFGALRDVAVDKVNDCFGRLRNDADHLLELHDRTPTYRLDFEMRYVGQAFELTISLEAETFSEVVRQALRPRFDGEHKRRFGHSFDEANEVEIVALTVRATDPSSQVVQRFSVPGASALNFERKAYFGEKFGVMTSPVIGRGELAGKPNKGPLIIEEFEGTTVVPPDAFVHRDGADNIIIELEY